MSRHGGSDGGRTDGGQRRVRGPAQPTVMVSSGEDGLARSVPTDILAACLGPGDGVVAITTRDAPAEATTRLTSEFDGLESSDVGVVAATSDAVSANGGGRTDSDAAASVATVGDRPDPSALVEAVEDAFESLDNERVHLLVDVLAAPANGDVEAVYDRVHEVAMAVGTEPGVALVAVDASGFRQSFVERLTHLFDVHIRLREDEGCCEACWTTLTTASDGWRSWAEVDVCEMRSV